VGSVAGHEYVAASLRRGGEDRGVLQRQPLLQRPRDVLRWSLWPDGGECDEPLEGIDGVVHLAGEGIGDKRWTDEQKRRILESRTKGTSLLADALASLTDKPTVLISGSAIGFYGNRGDEELTETSGRGEGFLADVVTAWEAAAEPAAAAGVRVPRIRTGIVLSPTGGVLQRLAGLARFGLLGKLGSGHQWMSWISLADEVGAIRFLLEHDVVGPVNLTAPSPVTNEVFTKTLGRVLHRPTFLPVPRFGPNLLVGAEAVGPPVLGPAFRHRVQEDMEHAACLRELPPASGHYGHLPAAATQLHGNFQSNAGTSTHNQVTCFLHMTPLDLEIRQFFESLSVLPAVSISGQRLKIKSHWALVAIARVSRQIHHDHTPLSPLTVVITSCARPASRHPDAGGCPVFSSRNH